MLASNIPGIIVSFWLNSGASKLQYYEAMNSHSESNGDSENQANTKRMAMFTPQDKLMLGVLSFWIGILVCVGWMGIGKGHEEAIIGIIVNINLLFFYGAPLQTIQTVIAEKSSDSIHTPTMILNCTNAGFWGAYGIAINNIVIYGPNGIGFFLSLCQAVLCCMYPKNPAEGSSPDVDLTPLLTTPLVNSTEGESGTEEEEGGPDTPSELV